MKLSNKAYDILKWVMILAVPLCTFITGIIQAIQTGDPIAIMTAVLGGLSTFIGAIIKASDIQYKKEESDDGKGME